MALPQNTYVGNGSTVLYSFTFPYIRQSDVKVSLNSVDTTQFTFSNATTLQLNTAPANGVAIRIYRSTFNDELAATFYPGSAIRAQDLNENFVQTLYAVQESTFDADSATALVAGAVSTSNTALTTANSAASSAASAVSSANSAVSAANSAVSTANTASTSASNAVSSSTTAVTTANTALSTANTALSNSNTATTTANSATSTANTALSNSNNAVSVSNTANSNASAAVSTANTASANASAAVTTANTASTTANSATSTANTANSKADAAIAAVASSVNYTPVANVASIPSSPANNTYIEIVNSTGVESFTPLAGLPSGFIGDSGLSVRLNYTTSTSSWNWLNYYANNAETRYLKQAGGTLTGALTLAGAPATGLQPATKTYVDGFVTSLQGDIGSVSTATTSAQNTANIAVTNAAAAQTTANAALPKAGGTMTGDITLVGAPTASLHPTTKAYVDAADSTLTTAAAAAQTTANTAVTNAATAQTTANTAVTNSAAAQTTADAALPKAGGTLTGSVTFAGTQPTGTTTTAGIVQLTDSTSSTSTTTAATPNSVKGAYDFTTIVSTTANAALPKAGGLMTGALGVVAGSAAAPSAYFTGDLNTGIYSPGADQLALSTGGTGRLFVDATGRVGVGTNSPQNTFVVSNAGAEGLEIVPTGGSPNVIAFNRGTATYAPLTLNGSEQIFQTSGTERLRITAAGLVGVGTSAPSQSLQVVGAIASTGQAPALTSSSAFFDYIASLSTARFAAVGNTTGTAAPIYFSQYSSNGSVGRDAVVIDSSGRVGIGTTSPSAKLSVSLGGVAGTIVQLTDGIQQSLNIASDAGSGSAGVVSYDTANGASQAFKIGTAEKVRIDGSGRLLVGTSTTAGISRLTVRGNTVSNDGLFEVGHALGFASIASGDSVGILRFTEATNSGIYAQIVAQADGTSGNNDYPGRLVFSVTRDGQASPTEAARVNNSGSLKVTTSGSYGSSTGKAHEFLQSNGNFNALEIRHTASSGGLGGISISYTGQSPNNTGNTFFYAEDSGPTLRAEIRSNGGLANYQANNVNLSDINTKKDISPAAGTWDCIKEWEIVNYRYKDQSDDADLNLGVIAQQVAESCPEVITVFQEAKEATETEPAKEERLGVKEQQMYWMAIKALQEAMERIEQLEAKVAALEAS